MTQKHLAIERPRCFLCNTTKTYVDKHELEHSHVKQRQQEQPELQHDKYRICVFGTCVIKDTDTKKIEREFCPIADKRETKTAS